MKKTLKKWIGKLLMFTTGAGYYGMGFAIAAIVLWFLPGFNTLAACALAIFIHKNYVEILVDLRLKKRKK